jgi:hypothetical protein
VAQVAVQALEPARAPVQRVQALEEARASLARVV